jgi:hypothetical protein
MTFEEFENATDIDLRRETKLCFDKFNNPMQGEGGKAALLLEAQFYIQEVGRREDSRVAKRDFWLEIGVIVLILAEIVLSIYGIKLAIRQDKDEQALMDKHNGILNNLQTSTAQTATAMKDLANLMKTLNDNTSASERMLSALSSTTVTMNKGVHDQLSLFYDPSIVLTYDLSQNRIFFQNTGRSRITMRMLKVDNQEVAVVRMKLISAGSTLYIEAGELYTQLSAALAKGDTRSVPVEAHLENELGRHFVLNGTLYCVWVNDKLQIHAQNNSVLPEE